MRRRSGSNSRQASADVAPGPLPPVERIRCCAAVSPEADVRLALQQSLGQDGRDADQAEVRCVNANVRFHDARSIGNI